MAAKLYTSSAKNNVSSSYVVVAVLTLVIGIMGYQRLRFSPYEGQFWLQKLPHEPENDEVHFEIGKVRDTEEQTLWNPTHVNRRLGPTTLRGKSWAKQQLRDANLVGRIKVHGLLKHYNNFTSYVIESRQNESITPL
ncbi:unnamed protein product, partial [Choristocarpus tenellus]